MPLCRPALAALATLEVTWIYNEFFWATVLHAQRRQVPGHELAEQPARASSSPTTTCCRRARCIAAAPVIVIFFLLQKHFVAGLTLGANKG